MIEITTYDLIRQAIIDIATRALTEHELETATQGLLVTGGDTSRRDYATRLKEATPKKSAQELLSVAERAEALHAALASLHAPGVASIGRFDWHLTFIGGLAITARERAKEFYAIAQETNQSIGGLPEHSSPQEALAHCAALVFLDATGKWPTLTNSNPAGGPKNRGENFSNSWTKFLARGV